MKLKKKQNKNSMGKNYTNLLLVDDDDDCQELLSIYLDFHGYKVFKASNGVDAIGIIDTEDIDIIITEWILPMIDGLRFLQWLRHEAKKSLPVLILTSMEKLQEKQIKKAGADAVIYKPVKGSVIVQQLESLIQV